MEYIEDYYRESDEVGSIGSYDTNKLLIKLKQHDKGHNKITRNLSTNSRLKKNKKIEVYTSGDRGSNIRDAETGDYYPYKVGSKDEDLFYSVILATGETKTGSSTLFYKSPNHFALHQNINLNLDKINKWEMKNNKRVKEIKESQEKKLKSNNLII